MKLKVFFNFKIFSLSAIFGLKKWVLRVYIEQVEYRGYLQDGIWYLYRTEDRTASSKVLSGSISQQISGCSTLLKYLHVIILSTKE